MPEVKRIELIINHLNSLQLQVLDSDEIKHALVEFLVNPNHSAADFLTIDVKYLNDKDEVIECLPLQINWESKSPMLDSLRNHARGLQAMTGRWNGSDSESRSADKSLIKRPRVLDLLVHPIPRSVVKGESTRPLMRDFGETEMSTKEERANAGVGNLLNNFPAEPVVDGDDK